MSSKYYEWKYKDVQHDEKVVLTPAQKRRNWWHYHKWHVLIAVVLAAIAVDIGKDALGIGKTEPDYQIAAVLDKKLPEEAVEAVESAIAAYGEDLNNDGKVVVQLNQYPVYITQEDSDEASYAEAAQVQLLADVESCDSFLFISTDGETFQKDYDVLAYTDGASSAEESTTGEYYYCWSDCPVLSSLPLGNYTETILGQEITGDIQELFADTVIGQRVYLNGLPEYYDQYQELWNRLTENHRG